MPVPKKRAGKIALAAARPMTERFLDMQPGQSALFSDYVNRWLDNGHNLDAADIEWLAAVAIAVNHLNTK